MSFRLPRLDSLNSQIIECRFDIRLIFNFYLKCSHRHLVRGILGGSTCLLCCILCPGGATQAVCPGHWMTQESHLAFSKCGFVQSSLHLINYLMGQCGTSSQLSLQLCWSKLTRVLTSRLPVSDEHIHNEILHEGRKSW